MADTPSPSQVADNIEAAVLETETPAVPTAPAPDSTPPDIVTNVVADTLDSDLVVPVTPPVVPSDVVDNPSLSNMTQSQLEAAYLASFN